VGGRRVGGRRVGGRRVGGRRVGRHELTGPARGPAAGSL